MQFRLNQIITKIKDLQKTHKGQVTLLLIVVLLLCSVFTISIGIKNLDRNISNEIEREKFTGDIARWKTYRNEKYGVQFKYPEWMIVEEHLMLDDEADVKYVRLDFLIDKKYSTIEYDLCGEYAPLYLHSVGIADIKISNTVSQSSVNPMIVSFNFNYNHGGKVSCNRSVLLTPEIAIMQNSVLYFKPDSDLIDFLKSPVRIIDNETLDVSKWKTYKNDKEGIEFKYPSEYSLTFEQNNYGNTLIKKEVRFSVPTKEIGFVRIEFSVGWRRYGSLQEEYVFDCMPAEGVDEGDCGGSTIGAEVEKINNERNLSVSGFNARYSTSTGPWNNYHKIMENKIDINYPNFIVKIYGSVENVLSYSKNGKQLNSDLLEIMKTVARTIKVSN